jgi:dienelactone hydrolase
MPVVVAVAMFGCATAPKSPRSNEPPAERADALMKALQANDADAAIALFDRRMKRAVSKRKLEELLQQVKGQQGAIVSWVLKSEEEHDGHRVHTFDVTSERGRFISTVAISEAGEVSGFFLKPALRSKYEPLPIDPNAPFREEEVKVGAEPWVLDGTLTLPKTGGPFPAAILVQGSGPHDRDETNGPNRPFKDIAEGLSSKGIAVLRYDKRTFTHGSKMSSPTMTVEEEYVTDALAAVQLLKSRSDIDAKRIYVIGHSQGGTLAPEIGVRSQPIAGVVLLAAAYRPLPELAIEQMRHLGVPEREIAPIEAQAKRVLSGEMKTTEKFLGVEAHYWLDLQQRDHAGFAKKLNVPILVLQGQRDYQVTEADFKGWKTALAGTPHVTFEMFPGLNHLFLKGEGKSMPAEYQRQGNVDAEVIAEIAAFISAQAH